MESIKKVIRWVKRLTIYTHAFILSLFLRRKIVIEAFQVTGLENFWQTSYVAAVHTPGKKVNFSYLRAAPRDSKFDRVVSAIGIAEGLCKELFMPRTPVFIKTDRDTVVIIVEEN